MSDKIKGGIIWVKGNGAPTGSDVRQSPEPIDIDESFPVRTTYSTDIEKKIKKNGIFYPETGVVPKVGTKTPMENVKDSYINAPKFGKLGKKSSTTLDDIIDKLNSSLDIQGPTDTVYSSFKLMTKSYNRFKYGLPNLELSRGFGHVFFIKPDCNLFEDVGRTKIRTEILKSEAFKYISISSPDILRELTSGGTHSVMMTLSNYSKGFALNDEEIETDKYGRTYAGYEINYGKHAVASKVSGTVAVSFKDDKELNIYKLMKMWVEYIEGCYRGRISPKTDYIVNKVLDYAGAMYYFLTDETGENLIFWSKYYGIFPTTIPSSQYSWRYGSAVNPESSLDITFKYSFKEDYNPYSLMEFNTAARANKASSYMPVYDPKLNTVSTTWVGVPYIDLVKDSKTGRYIYKLRFRKKPSDT